MPTLALTLFVLTQHLRMRLAEKPMLLCLRTLAPTTGGPSPRHALRLVDCRRRKTTPNLLLIDSAARVRSCWRGLPLLARRYWRSRGSSRRRRSASPGRLTVSPVALSIWSAIRGTALAARAPRSPLHAYRARRTRAISAGRRARRTIATARAARRLAGWRSKLPCTPSGRSSWALRISLPVA